VSRADDIRAELAVAELEDELVRLKDEGTPEEVTAVKGELRYARWLQRGGPEDELAALAATGVHTNRAVAAHYLRWQAESTEG
jgi:hypothetical protein